MKKVLLLKYYLIYRGKKMNMEILNITAIQMGALVNEGIDRITIMGINNPAVITATYKDNKLTVTYYSHAVKRAHIIYRYNGRPRKSDMWLDGLLLSKTPRQNFNKEV